MARSRKNRRSTTKKNKDLSKIKCFKCHTIGHFAYRCPHENKRKERKRKKKKNTSKELAPVQTQKKKAFLRYNDSTVKN